MPQLKIHSQNYLFRGDNLIVLDELRINQVLSEKIKLVYIDPPFATGNSFYISKYRNATISKERIGRLAYSDQFTRQEYLDFLEPRLKAIRAVMATDASIYLHIDYKIGHYVKCLMDKIFGEKNFINDISRIKCNPKNFYRPGYGNMKDMILFYSKSYKYIWNDLRNKIEIEDDVRFKRVDDKGRRYTTTPVHAPGETLNGATGKPWRGLKPPAGRHWRYSPDVLEALDRKGQIEWSSRGNPRKKLYADDVSQKGMKIQDVWHFKDPQITNYPTEKNMDMLKLVILNSSRPGDWVLDAFCGSGSTLCAAEETGRKWIGIDNSSAAIAVCKRRLSKTDYNYLSYE